MVVTPVSDGGCTEATKSSEVIPASIAFSDQSNEDIVAVSRASSAVNRFLCTIKLRIENKIENWNVPQGRRTASGVHYTSLYKRRRRDNGERRSAVRC